MTIIGYVTLYIKAEYEQHYPDYIEYSVDFAKPLTKKALKDMLQITKEALIKMNKKPVNLDYVDREEYMSKKRGPVIVCTWGKNE